MIEYFAIVLAILIGIAHFFSERFCKICNPFFKQLGSLLFSVIRHSIPTGAEGKPLYFVLGVVIYSPIVILSWFI